MKKLIPLLLTSAVLFTACSNGSEDKSKDRIVDKTMYLYNSKEDKVDSQTLKILFKSNSDIPYLSVNDFSQMLKGMRQALKSDGNATVTSSGKKSIITLENNETCEFNADSQQIIFSDFDLFTFATSTDLKPLTPYEVKKDTKSIKATSNEYKKGNKVTVDLNKYDLIDIYDYNGILYLPVQTLSDVILSNGYSVSLAYNAQDLFYISAATPLEIEVLGMKTLSALGEQYYKGPKQATVSQTYAKFDYQSLCLNLDYSYGMKNNKKITSFDNFFNDKGYKNDLLNTDVHTLDNTLCYALSELIDGHTAGNTSCPLYEYGEGNADRTKYNKDWITFMDDGSKLQKNRSENQQGYKVDNTANDTAFITFDAFDEISEDLLYLDKSLWEADTMQSNTQTLFAYAYQQITSNKNIKNVVVDLATNDGGSASSLVYGLCTLLGEVELSTKNPTSGATNTTKYKADINADGNIDANDKSLFELGYNIFFIDSRYSFSSANAMAVYAKANNSKVTILGENTGGGPCSVERKYSAIGGSYQQSGLTMLSKKVGDEYVDIDSGVKPDTNDLTIDTIFERDYIAVMLDQWRVK